MKIRIIAKELHSEVEVYFDFGEKLSEMAKDLLRDFLNEKYSSGKRLIVQYVDDNNSRLNITYFDRPRDYTEFFIGMSYIGCDLVRELEEIKKKFLPIDEEFSI